MEDEPIMPNIESIYIRDPFILPWQGTYYLHRAYLHGSHTLERADGHL